MFKMNMARCAFYCRLLDMLMCVVYSAVHYVNNVLVCSLMAGGVPFPMEAGIGGPSGSGSLGLPFPPPLAAFGSLGGVNGLENLAAMNLAMSGLQQLAGAGGPNPLNMNMSAFAGLSTPATGGPGGPPQSPNVGGASASQQMQMPPFGMPMPPFPGLGMGGLGGLGLGMGLGMGVGPGMGMGPLGMSVAARRKNATRETTSTLKSWLQGHRKNPYPTKAEKIMLAILTKMTLTQVCSSLLSTSHFTHSSSLSSRRSLSVAVTPSPNAQRARRCPHGSRTRAGASRRRTGPRRRAARTTRTAAPTTRAARAPARAPRASTTAPTTGTQLLLTCRSLEVSAGALG